MVNYLEILRLSSLGYSQRTIESTAHCSRHTARSVLQAAQASGIAWPLGKDVTNSELERMLFPDKHTGSSLYVEPDYPYIHRELAKPGVTMALLWNVLRLKRVNHSQKFLCNMGHGYAMGLAFGPFLGIVDSKSM